MPITCTPCPYPFILSPFSSHHHAPISSLSFTHHTLTSIITPSSSTCISPYPSFLPFPCRLSHVCVFSSPFQLQTSAYPYHSSHFFIFTSYTPMRTPHLHPLTPLKPISLFLSLHLVMPYSPQSIYPMTSHPRPIVDSFIVPFLPLFIPHVLMLIPLLIPHAICPFPHNLFSLYTTLISCIPFSH